MTPSMPSLSHCLGWFNKSCLMTILWDLFHVIGLAAVKINLRCFLIFLSVVSFLHYKWNRTPMPAKPCPNNIVLPLRTLWSNWPRLQEIWGRFLVVFVWNTVELVPWLPPLSCWMVFLCWNTRNSLKCYPFLLFHSHTRAHWGDQPGLFYAISQSDDPLGLPLAFYS